MSSNPDGDIAGVVGLRCVCNSLVQHKGPTDVREVLRVHFLLAERAVAVLQKPWTDTASVKQMGNMTWQRTD